MRLYLWYSNKWIFMHSYEYKYLLLGIALLSWYWNLQKIPKYVQRYLSWLAHKNLYYKILFYRVSHLEVLQIICKDFAQFHEKIIKNITHFHEKNERFIYLEAFLQVAWQSKRYWDSFDSISDMIRLEYRTCKSEKKYQKLNI